MTPKTPQICLKWYQSFLHVTQLFAPISNEYQKTQPQNEFFFLGFVGFSTIFCQLCLRVSPSNPPPAHQLPSLAVCSASGVEEICIAGQGHAGVCD